MGPCQPSALRKINRGVLPRLPEIALVAGGGFVKVDEKGLRKFMTLQITQSGCNGALIRPRGLLAVPPEVEQIVSREKNRLQPYMDKAAEDRIRDDLTLQYYFEGTYVAYRRTSQGIEVLAIGLDEIGELVKKLPPDRRPDVVIAQP
jgi:hypothetical protein